MMYRYGADRMTSNVMLSERLLSSMREHIPASIVSMLILFDTRGVRVLVDPF